MNLYDLEINDSCTISSLPPEVVLLEALGLRKNLKIRISNKQPLGGPIILKIGTRDVAVGKKVAELIQVERCDSHGQ